MSRITNSLNMQHAIGARRWCSTLLCPQGWSLRASTVLYWWLNECQIVVQVFTRRPLLTRSYPEGARSVPMAFFACCNYQFAKRVDPVVKEDSTKERIWSNKLNSTSHSLRRSLASAMYVARPAQKCTSVQGVLYIAHIQETLEH